MRQLVLVLVVCCMVAHHREARSQGCVRRCVLEVCHWVLLLLGLVGQLLYAHHVHRLVVVMLVSLLGMLGRLLLMLACRVQGRAPMCLVLARPTLLPSITRWLLPACLLLLLVMVVLVVLVPALPCCS
jgi:hypothetical protein